MKTKKYYFYRLEPNGIPQDNEGGGMGYGDSGNWVGDGASLFSCGDGDGDGWGNGFGNGDGNRDADGFGIGSGSFIIEDEEDEVGDGDEE